MHAWVVLDNGRTIVRQGSGDTAMAKDALSAQMRIEIRIFHTTIWQQKVLCLFNRGEEMSPATGLRSWTPAGGVDGAGRALLR
jgi:hypothetical protein